MTTAQNPVRRHRRPALLLVVALAVMCTLLTAPGSAQAASGDYIVALRDGVSLQAHLKALRITPNRVYSSAINGYEAVLNDTQYQRELSSPDVIGINPNSSVATGIGETTKPGPAPQPPQVPSTAVKRIGALQSPTAHIDGVDDPMNIDIAIVDTGIQVDHPDLRVAGGVDCVQKKSFDDPNGHGTEVGGFAGAIDNAIGRVGVAPGARLWAVRALNKGGNGQTSDEICGLDWITAHSDVIDVANLSIGGRGSNTPNCGFAARKRDPDLLHQAICGTIAAGVTVVVSAGNDSADASGTVPAAYDEVITVSALTDTDGAPGGLGPAAGCGTGFLDDHLAPFSNFGAAIDIAAPGVCIATTTIGSSYGGGSGTSFSAPLVSGAAALYLVNHPGATPAQVKAALLAAAEPGPIPGDPDTYPEGIVNVSSF